MRKRLTLIVALAVVLTSLTPATAGDFDRRAVEKLAIDLEAMLGTIEGVDLDRATAQKLDNGMTSITLPFAEAELARLRAEKAAGAKDFKTTGVGLQLSDPNNLSALIFAAASNVGSTYNVWCVVANIRANAETKNAKIQIKGVDSVSGDVTFNAGALVAIGFEATIPDNAGIYNLQCKVGGAGKAKASTFAV